MDTGRLQYLLEAYLSAETTTAQEEELRDMLREVDDTTLPAGMYADTRLVRRLLAGPAAIPAPPDFRIALGRQLDALADKDGTIPDMAASGRRWNPRVWRIIASGMSAAAVALLLVTVGRHTDVAVPPETDSAPLPRLAVAAPAMPQHSGEKDGNTSSSSAIVTSRKRQRSETVTGTSPKVSGPMTEMKDGVLVITEYYTPSGHTESQVPDYGDAPVVVRTENGEAYTCASLEEAPEAMAMLEQAFELLSLSGQEVYECIDDSERIVTNAINQIEIGYEDE